VEYLSKTLSFQVDTNGDATLLRDEIERRLQNNIPGYILSYGLSSLEHGVPLPSYGIKRDSLVHMSFSLRGGKWFQTLLYFFQEHERRFLRTVELPDRTTDIELTELGCLVLNSWIHCLTTAFVAGKTWDGVFGLDDFALVGAGLGH
jgi:hypothetical protein